MKRLRIFISVKGGGIRTYRTFIDEKPNLKRALELYTKDVTAVILFKTLYNV